MQATDPVLEVLQGPGVEVVETHGSRVFLHDSDVYKVKKPVRFPFLDYTTLELRKHACEEELRVNRRCGRDVYLGVRPIVRLSDGSHAMPQADAALPDDAEVVEWVVHMRRLPDAHRADHRLEAGDLDGDAVRRIASYLAEFHAGVERDRDPQGGGSLETLRANVEENLQSLEPHARAILGFEATERLRKRHLAGFEAVRPLLKARIADGHVLDGHGDFRLEHVYLDESGQVTLLDAIEFDRSFRVADACADVAFLAMDLDSRGRTDLGEAFLAAYAHESGDHDLYALVDFYMTYWCLVRAKVDAMRAEQIGTPEADVWMESCARRLFLAGHHVDGAQRGPAVFAVTGLIASGKSRVARSLGQTLAAPVLSSDRVRKQLADRDPSENLGSVPYQGAYSEDKTREVYDELLRRAELIAATGRPVVLDASFQDTHARDGMRALSSRLGIPYLFIECRAPKEEIRARLERRDGRAHDSDARAPLLEQFQSQYPPWNEADQSHRVTVDTTQPRAVVDQQVLHHARTARRSSRQSLSVSIGRGANS